jgi:SAM-dependent methyltransferase
MLTRAAARGIETAKGTAEALPFPDRVFAHAAAVATICFVDSPEKMLAEAAPRLRPGGKLVIGFVDGAGGLGQSYLEHQAESDSHHEALFLSAAEVGELLHASGFAARMWAQTLFRPLGEISAIEPMRPDTATGAFVVVSADRATRGLGGPVRSATRVGERTMTTFSWTLLGGILAPREDWSAEMRILAFLSDPRSSARPD